MTGGVERLWKIYVEDEQGFIVKNNRTIWTPSDAKGKDVPATEAIKRPDISLLFTIKLELTKRVNNHGAYFRK